MKRLKQIGALLAIAFLIGFGLGAMIFAFIDTPFAHKALTVCLYCAITVPVLICQGNIYLCHDAGCQGSVAPR